jgi:cytidine deaminase
MQDLAILSTKDAELVKLACEHIKKRYKKDRTTIGAALRTTSGNVYTGTNLKYRTRNTSTCAGATAVHTALDAGSSAFDTLVEVKYFPDTNVFEIVNPCGLCRQLYCYNAPCKVIVDDGAAAIKEAEELLPLLFR